MNRYIMSLVLCCVLPFGACAWLNAHAVDAPGAFPGVEDVSSETSTVADSETPLPTHEEEVVDEPSSIITITLVPNEPDFTLVCIQDELACAIVYERPYKSPAIASERLDMAFAAMFERPDDPASPPSIYWLGRLSAVVAEVSGRQTTIHLTTAEDPVFSRNPNAKKVWRSAHTFIRVERVMKDGKKRSSGIILSAPEPKEKRTSFPVDKEEAGPMGPDSNPLGQ